MNHFCGVRFDQKVTGSNQEKLNFSAETPVKKMTENKRFSHLGKLVFFYNTVSVTLSVTLRYQLTRLSMFALFLSLTLGSAGCSKTDTIAPEQNSEHSMARESSSILNKEGFENGRISTFWHGELRTPTAALIATDQTREGKRSLRFSWKPTQYDGTNPTMHSELATDPLTNGETERWYGYSVYMPSATMANDKEPIIFSQWHGVPDPGFSDTVPPIAFWLTPENTITMAYRASYKPILTLLQHTTSQKIMNLGAAPFDRWVDYVVHVKWDPTGKKGLLEVWQDGRLIVNEQNISIGYLQVSKPYWKVGIYAWTGKASHAERTLLYDDIRIGDASATYDDVKPGRANNTAR